MNLPEVDADRGDLAAVTGEAWDAVLGANDPPILFEQGHWPVRIEHHESGVRVVPVDVDRLRHRSAEVTVWYKRQVLPSGMKTKRPAYPPRDVIRNMLATPDKKLPPLTRIVGSPIVAPDGSIRKEPGYDAATRTYFAPADGVELPAVPDEPTREDIECALEVIFDELLVDFPCVGDPDRAHAVAAMLLPLVRNLVDGPTPLFVVDKPCAGSGATLLVSAITYVATGRPAAPTTLGRNEEETRKKITAALLGGPCVIFLDNLGEKVDSAALSSALTASEWEDRILGRSETVRLPVECVWIGTANNARLSNEIARRTLPIRLDAKDERPWLRPAESFQNPHLLWWVRENRARLVWAALVIVRAWFAAGCPRGTKNLGMFENFTSTMGGIFDVVGVRGFLGNLSELYEAADDEFSIWKSFVEIWWKVYRDRETTAACLFAYATNLDLGDGGERSQKIRLGKMLAQMRDRRFGDLLIKGCGTRQGAHRWKLVAKT